MTKEKWIEESSDYLVSQYHFDYAFALETSKVVYSSLADENLLEDYSIEEAIDEEMSRWGD